MTVLLNHIPFTTCPICKEQIRESRQWNQHTNGTWNEQVEFRCGARYEFSPNIGGPYPTWLCPKDPEVLKTEKNVNTAYAATLQTFEEQMLSAPFKTEVRNRIHESFHSVLRQVRTPKHVKG
jgi:hypothetical protein